MRRDRRVPRTLVLELLSRRGPMLRSEIPTALAGRASDREVDDALADLLARGLIVRRERVLRSGSPTPDGGCRMCACTETAYGLAGGGMDP